MRTFSYKGSKMGAPLVTEPKGLEWVLGTIVDIEAVVIVVVIVTLLF